MNQRSYYVYILTNRRNSVLYTGITNDLRVRVWQHKEKLIGGFSARYNVTKLVYYEVFEDPIAAITREKQIKGGSRTRKKALVSAMNPAWEDLFHQL